MVSLAASRPDTLDSPCSAHPPEGYVPDREVVGKEGRWFLSRRSIGRGASSGEGLHRVAHGEQRIEIGRQRRRTCWTVGLSVNVSMEHQEHLVRQLT